MMSFMQMPVKTAAQYMTIKSEDDLNRMIDICEELSDQYEAGDDSVAPLLRIVGGLIEQYENAHVKIGGTPEQMMQYLMEKHGHSQSDMTDVAARPVINAIIHGKRRLTRDHIERLIEKYKVTGDWFYS